MFRLKTIADFLLLTYEASYLIVLFECNSNVIVHCSPFVVELSFFIRVILGFICGISQ